MTYEVWLPFHPDELDGLPDGPNYLYWNGEQDYPADPADCSFYVVPYMKGGDVSVRPWPK